jgi:ATP-binding cassette subfamily B protein
VNGSLRVLWPFLRRQWRALVAASGATVIIAVAEILRPFPLKFVIDHLFGEANNGRFQIGVGDIVLVLGIAALVLGIALVEAAGDYLVDVHLERAGERIVHDLRVAIYAHLQRLSLGFHRQRHTGDLVTRLTGDVTAIGSIFSSSAGTLATAILTLAGMVVVGFLIDPVLAVVAFATAPLVAVVAFRFRQRIGTLQRRQRAVEGEIASLATEALSSIEQVKALGAESYEHGRLERKSEERRAAGLEATLVEGQFTRLIDIVGAIATAVVLVVGVVRVGDGALSPGDLIVMVTYVRRVYKPLRDVAREWVRFSRSMARAERVAELLSADQILEERGAPLRHGRSRGQLEFESVSFAYSPGRPAVADVSLSISVGERLALIGPSGAGKSTIAALAARFYDPVAGRVLIDGVDARDLPVGWLREQVGLVLQDPVLFSGTVAENIAWGISASRDDVVHAATAVGADVFIRQMPDGYDSQLDPGGTGLSGGQRQRIAVARTLLRDPALLVLDEPTTGLDAASERELLDGLDVLMVGRTTIIITHSVALARRADRVAVLEGGRLVRLGSPSDVLPESPSRSSDGLRPGWAVRDAAPTRVADPALPTIDVLLDTVAIAPLLGRSFNGGTPLEVSVRYLRYKPGTNLVVQYGVRARGNVYEAVGMIGPAGVLARRASRPENAALAELVADRVEAAIPLAYEADIGALFQWYPLDLALPALALPPADLRRTLRSAGLDAEDSTAEPERLAYKPRRRAVLRLDGHVVKLYRAASELEQAVAGQSAASSLTAIRAPRLEAVVEKRLMTVQSSLAGQPVADPCLAAVEAGELLAALHASRCSVLREFGPTQQFAAAAASARLVKAIVPTLGERLERILGRLAATMPSGVVLAPSHGDFNARQLLATDRGLAVTDFDEFSLAQPALDVSTYAAYIVLGRAGELEAAREALDQLLIGYRASIPDLDWYLASMILRRAARPFRYFEPDWPIGVAEMVGAAEEVLSRVR